MRPFLAATIAAACAMVSGPATAQGSYAAPGGVVEVAPGGADEFGTVGDIVYTAFGHEFQLFQGVEGPMDATTAGRVCQTGSCGWLTGLHVPTGALIRRIELSACDNNATQGVQLVLWVATKVPAAPVIIANMATGATATPGCNVFGFDLPTGANVMNGTHVYVLGVTENAGANLHWNQVRVIYRLQVSPAPGVASFGDVPTTHPAFRFVEALAASGITGGCGGGNYCPDAPLTRAQMAIFLATALGLHFPN